MRIAEILHNIAELKDKSRLPLHKVLRIHVEFEGKNFFHKDLDWILSGT